MTKIEGNKNLILLDRKELEEMLQAEYQRGVKDGKVLEESTESKKTKAKMKIDNGEYRSTVSEK